MSKELVIDNKIYTLEFGVEAAFYNECLETLIGLFADIGVAENQKDIKAVLNKFANIPQVSLTMFYAGLIEHHGINGKGDSTVPDKEAAKELLIKYITSQRDEELGSFAGIMAMCIEQMEADGYFKMIGLDGLMNESNEKVDSAAKKKKGKKKALELVE